MLYDYIIANYEKDEPIFLAELPRQSEGVVRQEMIKLIDETVCATIIYIFDADDRIDCWRNRKGF